MAIYLKKILGAENCYKDSISVFPSKLYLKINKIEADIVNLHWICNEMISIEEIQKIKKPIVWTIVDMWPFTEVHIIQKTIFTNFIIKYLIKTKCLIFKTGF